MRPRIDTMPRTTVSGTDYSSAAENHVIQARRDRYVKIREIALVFGSGFKTNGRYQMILKGAPFTNEDAPLSEVQPLGDTLTLSFDDSAKVYLAPGETLEINFRVTTSTGEVQAQVVGVEMTRDEYLRDKER